MTPEITPQKVAKKIADGDQFVLLDVREMKEIDMVAIPADFLEMALSELQSLGEDAVPMALQDEPEKEIVVFCHHGSRSAMVTEWLRGNGYPNAINMTGGIHAYAVDVDPSIGTY